MEDESVIEPGSEANPAEIGSEVNTEAAAVLDVPGAEGEGAEGSVDPEAVEANQIQNLGGKQPSTTDPFAQFKQALGELQSKGQPIEIKDLEHAKRLILSGHGADRVSLEAQQEKAKYEQARQANEWFSRQIDPQGPTGALVKQMKEDPKLFQDIANLYTNPATSKAMNYMRLNADVANTFASWIETWEKGGQLNPTSLENYSLKTQKEVYENRFKEMEQAQRQQQEQQAQQAEREELHSKVNEYNNGIPFTKKQLGAIQVMRDGMRLQPGFEQTTYAQALAELKEQGFWVAERKNPGPGAPGGAPPAQRKKPGYAEKDADQVRNELMANW
jgi:hypothetical protein